ncbi:hypothetical protein BDV25DRAFT_170925 [Aspergillus avenaceus]|uniref:Uncharacterized protein n=1 Tax=Aspergillus avenaceus TaxID=36643 RepID=A0A5N6U0A5_ASPAV|nr:hypothetical protein BDV25DRAFT_170925 [Aspergillus avenaceus]
MRRDLGAPGANGHTKKKSDPVNLELDVVIVGAGFAGIYLLHLLRKEGLRAKIVEVGHGLGGVWYWNSYPGARVDSPYPVYALNIPEVYNTWTWSESYPTYKELRQYFQHVDSILDISKDVIYGEKLVKATFDEATNNWVSETDNGSSFTSRFFCSCIGFAAKRLFPDWPGLKEGAYKGQILHSSFWPASGIDICGRKVAVVGTGATGVQLSQEVARNTERLTCFIRTPNLTWPMGLERIAPEQAEKDRELLPYLLGEKRYGNIFFDSTPKEREVRLERQYQEGGPEVLFSHTDILTNQAANDEIYNFWRRKTRARMSDGRKADVLAPTKPPYPFGGRRVSLEQDYYEQMDRPHVALVDLNSTPVTHLVSKGIVTSDGTIHEADLIILATGFDALTGGFKDIAITGPKGLTLEGKWNNGTHAYLGMTISGLPNLFYTYGALAPTAFANGPTLVELQANWIIEVMRKMQLEGLTKIDATQEAEREWKDKVESMEAMTLRGNAERSWYHGSNVPGKKREPLIYPGGIPLYRKEMQEAIVPDWKGVTVS